MLIISSKIIYVYIALGETHIIKTKTLVDRICQKCDVLVITLFSVRMIVTFDLAEHQSGNDFGCFQGFKVKGPIQHLYLSFWKRRKQRDLKMVNQMNFVYVFNKIGLSFC